MRKDFDSYFRELRKEPVSFVYKGETYTLGTSLPAIVMLRLIDLKNRENIDENESVELMRLTFGDENFNKLLRAGIEMTELEAIFTWTIEAFTKNDKGDSDPKGRQKVSQRKIS